MKIRMIAPLAVIATISIFLFAGCQSIEDQISGQIGQKIAETAVEQATGGKMKIDVNGGDVNIKTPEGEMKVNTSGDTVKITSAEGEAVFGGGDARPESVDQDLPNVDGAYEFGWVGAKEGGMFSFSVKGTDYKAVCEKEIELLGNNGWKVNNDFVMDFEGMATRKFDKGDLSVAVTCSAEKDDDKVSVIMIKNKTTN